MYCSFLILRGTSCCGSVLSRHHTTLPSSAQKITGLQPIAVTEVCGIA